MSVNQAEMEGYKKIKSKLITDIEEALRLANEQAKLMSSKREKNYDNL